MTASVPLRVSHLLAPVAFGGGEALLCDLLRQSTPGLVESVVTIGRAPILAEELAGSGIECQAVGEREVGAERAGRGEELVTAVRLRSKLRATLAQSQPDVVHAHGFPPSLLAATSAPRGARRVYTHHYERRPPGAVETATLTRLFSRYDALTTPADHLTAAMNRFFPGLPRPFSTLRIGIDERFYEGQPRPAWRDLFAPGTAIGVCVGRLVATKNQQLVIRALAALPATERERIGILLVGDGPAEAELRQLVEAEGLTHHVRLLGQRPRSEMPDLLASVDFGVFPTTTEASSVAAAEALASGLPVLALDIPSMVETVGPAGVFSTPSSFGADLARIASIHGELRPAVRQRAEASRVSRVRSHWVELYRDVAGIDRGDDGPRGASGGSLITS